MAKKLARPRDPNQLAKLIVDMTTGEVPNDSPKGPETPAAAARRRAIAKKAARSGLIRRPRPEECAEWKAEASYPEFPS